MGAKDVVKALLERLPDDCSLDDIIDRLYELERVSSHDDTALTAAQRAELERRLALLEREPGHLIPWADFRHELDRDE